MMTSRAASSTAHRVPFETTGYSHVTATVAAPRLRDPALLLHVANDAGVFWSHRLVFARAARRAGWDVHVATPAGPDVSRIVGEGFVHHAISLSRRGMNPLEEMRTLRELIRLFRRLRPAVVDCATIKPVLYGGVAASLARVPAVVHTITGLGHVFAARGVGASLRRALVYPMYAAAFRHAHTRVLFQNPNDMARLRFALRPGQAHLIAGSGVDPDLFCPTPEPDGPPVVLFAGRLLWTKGVADFVAAARQLRASGAQARFVIVGRPDEHNPAAVPAAQVAAWVDAGDVECWGQRDDMPAVIRQAAVVCLPTFYGEGVPKVLVEAAASARPVVTTDWPGCREIVRHEWNGLLVPPRAPAALSAAIGRLLDEPRRRAKMGARGRAIVVDQYTEAHVTSAVLRQYDELSPRAERRPARPA